MYQAINSAMDLVLSKDPNSGNLLYCTLLILYITYILSIFSVTLIFHTNNYNLVFEL